MAKTPAESLASLEAWMCRTFIAMSLSGALLLCMLIHLVYSHNVAEHWRAKLASDSVVREAENAARTAKIDAEQAILTAESKRAIDNQNALTEDMRARSKKNSAEFDAALKKVKESNPELETSNLHKADE